MRKRWSINRQDELYLLYFTPLLTQSSLEYLELIYFEKLYNNSISAHFKFLKYIN